MKAVLFILIAFISTLRLTAEEISSIMQNSEVKIIINSATDVTYESHEVVTVLSEKGNVHAQALYYEDEFREADIYNITVKDLAGNVIQKYNKKDFKHSAVISSASSYGEVVRFYLDCSIKSYPYTIEKYYSSKHKYFFEADFRFSDYPGTTVLKSSFEVIYPNGYDLNYEVKRMDLVRIDSSQKGWFTALKFTLIGEYSDKYEPYQSESNVPRVLIIPKNFEFGGIAGSFNSWKDYGLWSNQLWKGRDKLSKSASEEIDKLIASHSDKTELAKAIYAYTQNNMRYVAIMYGLGGIQTMSAIETSDLGYGDCKALSNFTATAMRYAGIEAYPAYVYGGRSPKLIDPTVVRDFFNHVILCLPQINDTTWLECTSNTAPFGYLSDFTDNRYALLLKPSGGELVKTATYAANENQAFRNTNIVLSQDGAANIQLDCLYRNLAMSKSFFYGLEFSSQNPIKAVKKEVNLPSFDLLSYTSEVHKNQKPQLSVSCSLEARNVGRRVGAKQMVKPFIMDLPVPNLKSDSARVNSVYFRHGYEYTDSISIALPEGYRIIQSLAEVDNTTQFGIIRIESELDSLQQELHITRYIQLNEGEFPAADYKDLTTFLDMVNVSQKAFLILE